MKNARLANQTPTEIIIIIRVFFQIAILAATMSILFQGDNRNIWMMYVRNIINSEAERKAI